jgi:serine/threonine protein kinase/TolB-like protein/Flp pilus assembly protein TadD
VGLSKEQLVLLSPLVDQGMDLPADAREQWIDGLSEPFVGAKDWLRKIFTLEGSARRESLLATLPKLGAGEPMPDELAAGARVGAYELIRRLGAGGMAEVWLARRADGAIKREVALKMPRLLHWREDLAVRFARERDILASLEHPHIARLYDVGSDAQGRPYLAMEYVQGQTLTEWCDVHRRGIRERLQLFLQVLEAVQYAHERQIIHRDLKPSNILVTDSGQVRLLDFGIAKLLEDEAGETQLTGVQGRALTPDFSSPEMLCGDPIDARCDIYSLGVILYELLSGARPYRLKSVASIGALDQAIVALEVKKPSTQIEPTAGTARASEVQELARQLSGDLDAIVLMALAKEPAQRYQSAAALSDDLRRYLEGKPIQAHPARVTYRLRKFARRNRALLTASVVAFAAMLAAVGYVRYRESRAELTVDAAAMHVVSNRSIAVLPFVDISENKDQEYFSDGLSEELIDMLTRIPDLRVPARTSSFYFKGKQATVAEIARVLGVAHVLEGSVRKSGNRLRITAQLVRADNGYHLWSETYDRELDDIFKVQDEIAGAVIKSLKISLFSSAPQSPNAGNSQAYALYLQGRYFADRSWDPATERKAVDLLQQAVRVDPSYARAWATLAGLYTQEATTGIRPAKEGRDNALRAADSAITFGPDLPETHMAKAKIDYYLDWDWAAAGAEIKNARALDPTNSDALNGEAILADALGHYEDALRLRQQAIALDPLSPPKYYALGRTYLKLGRLVDAEGSFHRSLDLNPGGPYLHWNIALALLLRGEHAAALAEMQRETIAPAQIVGLALIYHAMGKAAESNAAVREMENIAASHVNPFWCAAVHAYRGETDQAFSWLDRAYQAHDFYLIDMKGFPLLKNLESDSRYKAFLLKMNLLE